MSAGSLILVSDFLAVFVESALIDRRRQVTGVSGYLGAHIVHQLLEAGYRVRG